MVVVVIDAIVAVLLARLVLIHPLSLTRHTCLNDVVPPVRRVGKLAVAVLRSRGHAQPSVSSAPQEPSIFRQPSRHGAALMASPLEQAVDQEEADEARLGAQ